MIAILTWLTSLWNAMLPAVADHLWQSTIFALAAALLALALRKQSARIRYAIWLGASLKFFLPFSWLVAVGSRLHPSHALATSNSGIYLVEEFTQPFTQNPSPIHIPAAAQTSSALPFHWQAMVMIAWLGGVVVILCFWLVRWWKVYAICRRARILSEGRESSALRRLKTSMGVGQLSLLLSPTSLEPGVFGILRPVLLWPDSISEHLDDAHLEAVLAHELCHVQRKDNLAAFSHMLVESIFWFHPLVWWMGARLIEERERACDEAVIEMGNGRRTYAESILKVCEFCLSSPLTCVSGVTGADLKKRMGHIMTDRIVCKLNFGRKLLLWTAACIALALPIVYGMFNPTAGHADSEPGTALKYTAVSVKEHPPDADGMSRTRMMVSLMDGGLSANNVTAQQLIETAYRVQQGQITGAPDWLKSTKYDLSAKMDKAANEQFQALSDDQRGAIAGQMLQGLLADEFKLQVHQEARDLPVYELTVAEDGSKLQKTADGKHGFMRLGMGELTSNGAPLDLLTAQLSMRLGRTVVDKTGLRGNYAYSLHWRPDADEQMRMRHDEMIAPDSSEVNSSAPPLLTAIREQLGLTLQPQTDRVQVLVIDHIEQPTQE
ncbi:MAG TPA: M56 family metallopeptidase [Terriglobales bacterium]|nr:M56 family metallopeptidase [Terriglobales bacterium]HUK47910.1 M56 family metallopeptidase [Terriglobales bacterium]